MNEVILNLIKKDRSACDFASEIIRESELSNRWYIFFDDFASLLNNENSLVRNRSINIISSLVKWDDENKFDSIKESYVSHINDEKPITSRICIKALKVIGKEKSKYITYFLKELDKVDVSKYKDSMSSLILKDVEEVKLVLVSY